MNTNYYNANLSKSGYTPYMRDLTQSEVYDLIIDLFIAGEGTRACYFACNFEVQFNSRFSVWVRTDTTLTPDEKSNILEHIRIADLQ